MPRLLALHRNLTAALDAPNADNDCRTVAKREERDSPGVREECATWAGPERSSSDEAAEEERGTEREAPETKVEQANEERPE